MKSFSAKLQKWPSHPGGRVGLALAATALTATSAIFVSATPALASTKLTCSTGFSGTCSTGSLYPWYDGPDNGIFYIGTGAGTNPVELDVVEADNGFVHTAVIVSANTVWHDYRGGFNPNKKYYLRVGTAQSTSNMVVGSIENRPL